MRAMDHLWKQKFVTFGAWITCSISPSTFDRALSSISESPREVNKYTLLLQATPSVSIDSPIGGTWQFKL